MEKCRSPTFKKKSGKDCTSHLMSSDSKAPLGPGSSYKDVAFLFASALAEMNTTPAKSLDGKNKVVVETENEVSQEDRDMQILRESWKSLVNLITVAWMTVTLLAKIGYQMLLNRLRFIPKYSKELFARYKSLIGAFVQRLIPAELTNFLKFFSVSKAAGKKESAKSAIIVLHNFANSALDSAVIALLEDYYVIRCEQQEAGWFNFKRPSFVKLDDGIRIGLDFKKLDQVTKVSAYLQNNLSIPVSYIVLGITEPSSEYYGQLALCRMLSEKAKKDMSVFVTAARVNVVQSFDDFESLAFASSKSTSEIAVDVAALNKSIRGEQLLYSSLRDASKTAPEPLKKADPEPLKKTEKSSKSLTSKPLSAPKFADSISKILK